mmetsp:Transcript_29738/g.78989  ORF Transcript_29738/g.78989 Transcript_29738/m.78989 type:complete len:655 (-) Transcript_29738:340-2304(-)
MQGSPAPTQFAWRPLQVGEHVQYFAASLGQLLCTVVTEVDPATCSVRLACKPTAWLTVAEQGQKVTRGSRQQQAMRKAIPHADTTSHNLRGLMLAESKGELEQIARNNFDKFDSDNSGELHLGEFLTLCGVLSKQFGIPESDPQLLPKLFASYDINGDGTVDKTEFVSAFTRLVKLNLAKLKVLDLHDLVRTKSGSFHEAYEIDRRLGAGAMGVTYIATEKNSGKKVCVKVPNDCTDTDDFDKVRNLSHPNIMKVFELYREPTKIYVVSELCAGGDLFGAFETAIKLGFRINFRFIAHVMKETVEGVHFLHTTVKMCHNDLKPENVLLDRKLLMEDFHTNRFPRCIVGDFGLCRAIGVETQGDPRYKPPEIYMGQTQATVVGDSWALGVMLFELLSGGKLIFTNERNRSNWQEFCNAKGGVLYQALMQGLRHPSAEPDWNQIRGSARGEDFCRKLLQRDPRARLRPRQALEHPFLKLAGDDDGDFSAELQAQLGRRCHLSRMKGALLNMVANKLSGEAVEHFAGLWRRFDLDRDGTISRVEFVRVVVENGGGIDAVHAQELWEHIDIDSGGTLNFNEFVALMFNSEQLGHEILGQAFRSIFAGCGQVSMQQFISKFPKSAQAQPEIVADLFREIDVNNDGSVSQAEFVNFIDNV